jgi:hypothetical protein
MNMKLKILTNKNGFARLYRFSSEFWLGCQGLAGVSTSLLQAPITIKQSDATVSMSLTLADHCL